MHRKNNRRRKSSYSENKEVSTSYLQAVWFIIWLVVYFALMWVYLNVISVYDLFSNDFVFYIGFGLFLFLASQFIHAAIKKSYVNFHGIFVWTIIYSIILFILDPILSKFNIENFDIFLVVYSSIFTLIVVFLKRTKIAGGNLNSFKISGRSRGGVPSQVISGIIAIIVGFLIFRFANVIFIDWLRWPEGVAWSWLFGLIFLIGGFLAVLAWWRNHVSMFTTRHRVKWN